MNNLIFLAVVMFLSCTNAGLVFKRKLEGPCPEVTTVESLKVADYLGRWYQSSGIPWNISPEGCRCIAADYADLGDGSISVFNQQIEPNNQYSDACGRACQPDPERPGELFVTFGPTGDDFCQFEDPSSAPANYKILSVDTTSYSSVYSCSGDSSFEVAWILTREPNPSDEVIDQAMSAFADNGIDLDKFVSYPAGDVAACTYEPPEGQAACNDEEKLMVEK